MKKFILAAAGVLLAAQAALAQVPVGEVDTTWKLLGSSDRVVVERFDDPKVENVSCYISRAVTGGITGSLGIAEDPSRFSIACRATGEPRITGTIERSNKGEVVFSEKTSFLFKTMRISRFYDAGRNCLVYLVWSTKLIDGSPFNNVTAISLNNPR